MKINSFEDSLYIYPYFDTFIEVGWSVLEYMSVLKLFCTDVESIWTMYDLEISKAICKLSNDSDGTYMYFHSS